ncbi:hypothetical protein [Marinobacter sp. ELB17]|uniref:hypothetical protein n=1 Tax=Marinobacter sp. ELB17 TaxID=270374 RepID=UPI0000F3B38D|nr:hypothetical protein [Marinobacter sp. ELB17]EAZ98373.1 hypothetical protein MELB17_09108 [Marinobacter sp. ELB17]
MSDNDDESSWPERAAGSVKKGLEFLKEYGGDIAKTSAIVTAVVAATSYAATFVGYQMSDGTAMKVAAGVLVAAYKVYSEVKKYSKDKESSALKAENPHATVQMEDYISTRGDLSRLLKAHEATVYTLSETESANRILLKSNQDLSDAIDGLAAENGNLVNVIDELVEANEVLKTAVRVKHDSDIKVAELKGELTRLPYDFDKDESVIKFVDDEPESLQGPG